ncbi:MAG: hypothetical protein HYU64_19605, partial [Armatimonadetes bacterium]|nr:hypothetical protein [Armatimonadota bacterium]
VARRVEAFKFPDVLIVIPPFSVSTEEARGKLPDQVPFKDAVFNLSRLVFLLTSLSHGDGLLPWHTQDRLHQPYRASLLPGVQEVLSAVIPAGAPGACVSGAGSSILIFLPNRRESQRRVVKAAERAMPGARLLVTRVSTKGAEGAAGRSRAPDPSFLGL